MNSEGVQRGRTLRRGKTLTRPERFQPQEPMLKGEPEPEKLSGWVIFSRIVTFWAPSAILKKCGFPADDVIQAWREKMSLCFIISLICAAVVFLTLGLPYAFCPDSSREYIGSSLMSIGPTGGSTAAAPGHFIINENIYVGTNAKLPSQFPTFQSPTQIPDISSYFKRNPQELNQCSSLSLPKGVNLNAVTFNPCSPDNGNQGCPFEPVAISAPEYNLQPLIKNKVHQTAGYGWAQVSKGFTVIDGYVLNFNTYLNANPSPIAGDPLDAIIRATVANSGSDSTRLFYRTETLRNTIPCMRQKYGAGRLAKSAAGCFGVDFFMSLSLIVILGIIGIRFAMAFLFHWFVSDRLARRPKPNATLHVAAAKEAPWAGAGGRSISSDPNELFTILLVTCYSEGELSLRTTIDSLADTDFSDDKKLLFIVADGIITGSGNDQATPDICVDMLEVDTTFDNPEPQSYIAVAAGHKRHNCAKVYAGHFVYKAHRVPTLVVVKCGNPEEQGKPKAGNRGKRDSQLILMNFFSRVLYNERMTPWTMTCSARSTT
ncbi:hypothetical protein DSO57_1032694 [Entomophthora muscae]|uniref:Uncharacterized protein n=1 Tax=Entomophthora muscae TaxID=34485 RepID=A0ACC2TY61_9FUNG|nr:hypothetical protein DSO57_1032694 [Entomophthora muscae]